MLHADPSQFITTGATSQGLPLGQGGEADPDQKPCSYTMKLWVHISKSPLCSGAQYRCSGFGNLPNLRSLPAVTESPSLLLCLLMGTSVRVACVTVTGRTQQRAKSISLPPVVCNPHTEQGATDGDIPKCWQLMGWSPKTLPRPCKWL